MCARYKLAGDWQDFPVLRPADFADRPDVRPTHVMPVVRLVKGEWVVEMRRWGFARAWPGPSGRLVKHQLINAKGEELEHKKSFRKPFATARCLIPMSGWFEWPTVAGKKRITAIERRDHRVFAVGGLVETAPDPDSGEPVDAYTLITVGPNRQLASVHDRAPFVVPPADYAAWLDGDLAQAKALIGPYPEEDVFSIAPVAADAGGTTSLAGASGAATGRKSATAKAAADTPDTGPGSNLSLW